MFHHYKNIKLPFIWLLLVCYSYANITIYPLLDAVILPSNGPLQSSVVLTCGIEPPGYLHSAFWVTPRGTVINVHNNDPHYSFNEGQTQYNGRLIISISLEIDGLSYLDSGNYSCAVDIIKTTGPDRSAVRTESSVELKLLAKLTTEEQNVTISATADHTNFTCEMSDYILPDENMKWIGNDGAVLERSDKYTISFENGNQFMAQNGGSTRLPSRVSILTIHNPTICDAGNYFCTLDGTRQIITMTLEVKPTDDDFTCAIPIQVNRSTQISSRPVYSLMYALTIISTLLHHL